MRNKKMSIHCVVVTCFVYLFVFVYLVITALMFGGTPFNAVSLGLGVLLVLVPLTFCFRRAISGFSESAVNSVKQLKQSFPATLLEQRSPEVMLGELKTALVKTLRKRDREVQSDSAFHASFSLVAETETLGVVVLRVDTNNYGYQMRNNDWTDSISWENLVVATRQGYSFVGRVNLRAGSGYAAPFHISELENGSIAVSCSNGTHIIEAKDLNGGYDYPFELPPRSEMVKTFYDLKGVIVVIDDDADVGEYIQRSADDMGEGLVSNRQVYDLPGCVSRVAEAIRYLPGRSWGDRVSLVLVDGNFRGDGSGFNTAKLVPVLRDVYPNAVLFANSGKGENHANHNQNLLGAGCDCALPDIYYGYKFDLPRILARVAEFRPQIRVTKTLNINTVLKI
jgi:hypothetical protein